MSVDLPAGTAARAHRYLEPLHSLIYFAPEAEEEYVAAGLRPGRMGYFASRSAPMGAVSPGVTAATFYNFNPDIVARHLPRAWTLAAVPDVLSARLRGVDRAYRRLLGADVVTGPEVAEAAGLARTATEALEPHGRPLYAAHADLPWPEEPHLALWHALSLLREYRGDGHLAALLTHGLGGLDSVITHTATGLGFTVDAAKLTRGWSDEQWAAGVEDLRGRGLLGDDGLSAAGVAQRESVEAMTDTLDAAAWLHLGPERTERLVGLGRTLSRAVVGAGAFPAEVFAAR